MFPPTLAGTTVLPACPFPSTCVNPRISRHYIPQVFLFFTFARFSPAPVVFSRALGCGAPGAACTPRHKFGSREVPGAHALEVQSREIRQVLTGSLSVELEPRKTMENPYFSFFAFTFAPLSYSLSAKVRYSLQAFPAVTATETT